MRDAWEERERGAESDSPPWLLRRDRSRSYYRERDYEDGEVPENKWEEGEIDERSRGGVKMCVGRDGLPNVSALKL